MSNRGSTEWTRLDQGPPAHAGSFSLYLKLYANNARTSKSSTIEASVLPWLCNHPTTSSPCSRRSLSSLRADASCSASAVAVAGFGSLAPWHSVHMSVHTALGAD